MIDREKVIQHFEGALKAYGKDNKLLMWRFVQADILEDALALLKADQAYLRKMTGRLQLIADIAYDYDGYRTSKQLMELIDEMRDIAIRGLPEVKDD